MISTVPLACFLSMIRPPGVQFENALLQITPVDKAKCPFVKDGTDIGFRLYTRHNPTVPQELALDDDEKLFASNMDFHAPTVVYFSAFMETPDDGSGLAVREAYALRADSNFIMVDAASLLAGPWYFTAAENTWFVGRYTARFIDYLVARGLNLSNTHLIGHSLGAQSAGVCGAALKTGRVSRITGLDPALPLFTGLPLEQRLDKSDAEFVDVIHTDSGIFGYPDPIGHADFYPNGGISPQPGCELEVVIPQALLLNKCDNTKPPQKYLSFYLTNTTILTGQIQKLFTSIHHQQDIEAIKPIRVKQEAVTYITGDDYDRNDGGVVRDENVAKNDDTVIVRDENVAKNYDTNPDDIHDKKVGKLGKKEQDVGLDEAKELNYNKQEVTSEQINDSDKDFGIKKCKDEVMQGKTENFESVVKNNKFDDQIMIDSELKVNVNEDKVGFDEKKQQNHDVASFTDSFINDEHRSDDNTSHDHVESNNEESDDLMMTDSETEYSTELYEDDENEPKDKGTVDEIENDDVNKDFIEKDRDKATIGEEMGYNIDLKKVNEKDTSLDKLNTTKKDEISTMLEDQIMLESRTDRTVNVAEYTSTVLDGIFGKLFQIRDKRLTNSDGQQKTGENIDKRQQEEQNEDKQSDEQTGENVNDSLKQETEGNDDKEITVEDIKEYKPNNLTMVENVNNITLVTQENTETKLTERTKNDNKQNIDNTSNIDITTEHSIKKDNKKQIDRKRSRRFISFFKRSEAEESENFLFKMLNFLIKNRPSLPVYSVMREINTLVKSANGELNHVTKERNNFIGALPSLAPVTYTLELGNESKTIAFVKKLLGFAPKGDRLTINGSGK